MKRHQNRHTHTERGKGERALIITVPIEILPSFTQMKDPRKVILLESIDLNKIYSCATLPNVYNTPILFPLKGDYSEFSKP